MTPAGLLHSEICGSMSVCDSPQLFAAYHVFLRPLMPRHSPCALCSLITSKLISQLFESCVPYEISLTKLQFLSCDKKYLFKLHFRILFFPLFNFQDPSSKHSCFELLASYSFLIPLQFVRMLVGSSGLEPPTSRLSGVRSNHLSYEPMSFR